MDIKTYLKQKRISKSYIQKKTQLPYMTISDIVNGKTDIRSARVDVLVKLSKALDMDIQSTYDMCLEMVPAFEKDSGSVRVCNGKYMLQYKGRTYPICKANDENKMFIDYLAERHMHSIDREEKLATWN